MLCILDRSPPPDEVQVIHSDYGTTVDAAGPGFCPKIMRKTDSSVAAGHTNAMLAPPKGGKSFVSAPAMEI